MSQQSTATYDFFVAGRWRNKDALEEVVQVLRAAGKSVYCFLENLQEKETAELKLTGDVEVAKKKNESLPLDHPMIRNIFDIDVDALRQSDNLLLVLPAGKSAHIEAGVAYGLGKKSYALGVPETTDTLYCIFNEIFPDIAALKVWLENDNEHDDVSMKEKR